MWVKNILGSKAILDQKKRIRTKKFGIKKDFRVQKSLDASKNLCQKCLSPNIFLGQKNLVQKIVGPK